MDRSGNLDTCSTLGRIKQEKERPVSSPRATEKLTGQGPPGCPDNLRTQDDLNSILTSGRLRSKKTVGV